MLRRLALPAAAAAMFLLAAFLGAQGPIRYIYDESGRLVGVIDGNGDAAAYHYDAVGNLTSITRTTASQVAIIEFTPDGGTAGQSVTIYGTGFSATAGQNTVSFNGTSATVTAATTTTLVATLPAGATTGPITVTSPNGSTNSGIAFTVGSNLAPTISGFSPTVATAGSTVTISGTNFDATLANNRITVNVTRGAATTASATSVQGTVPSAAASGHIRVTTPNRHRTER